jgi:hypothetical protein
MIMEAISKNLRIKSRMFQHCNINNYTCTSPDGKAHNKADHTVINRRRHSGILDVQSLRTADCDTDHSLVVTKVRERLAVSKQRSQRFQSERERFNLKKLNEVEGKKRIMLRSEIGFQFSKIWTIRRILTVLGNLL